MKMRNMVVSGLAGMSLMTSASVFAETTSPHSFSANVGLFSQYNFRGIDFSDEDVALQGGFDYAHTSGWYAGVWASSLEEDLNVGNSLEVDFYGGYYHQFTDDFSVDVGLLQFYYPDREKVPGLAGGSDEDFDTTEVDVQLPAFTDAIVDASNDSLYRGEIIQLGTNRNGSNLLYFWEPAGLLDNPNSPTPNSSPTTDTTFKVTITDLNTGCEVIAYKKVKVFEINCDEPDIFIPSAFSPNGDGKNDVFLLRANYLAEIDLEIYNRWGELVFQTQNIREGWDGTYQGKEVDPDVFVYHLTVKCLDNQEYYTQGNVTVIR